MLYKLFLFSLFFLLPLAFSEENSSYTSSGKDIFEGDEYWDEQYLDLCDNVAKDTTWQWRRAVCFEYLISFQAVKVEIISWSPGLVIYRDMFTKKQVHDYLEIMKHQDFEEQQVVNDDGTEYYSKYRKANGTQIIAQDFPAALSIWKTVKNLIPTLNIESSEDIVALSYIRGGHYAAHHDFLEYPSEKEWDSWMKNYGNRFGTLIMAFETAKLGGATIFPSLNAAIRPNPGDAFFWFNAMGNTKQEDLSDHGGCPIYEGKKSISTIWFRMKNQPILTKLLNPGHISARWLIPDHF